jgi:hypothetical protein
VWVGLFWHEWASLKREWNEAHECQKRPNLHKNELNTRFFCSTSPLKAPNSLKSLKLAWHFILTSCDIYQNPFTQKKFLKFWQCRTKNMFRSIIYDCSFQITSPNRKNISYKSLSNVMNSKSSILYSNGPSKIVYMELVAVWNTFVVT